MVRYYWDTDDGIFTAIDEEVPGLSGAGPTKESALRVLRTYQAEMLEDQSRKEHKRGISKKEVSHD